MTMTLPTIWTKRDGTKIAIADMDTQHIKNAIAMMRRNGFCRFGSFWSMVRASRLPMGEGAADSLEREVANARPHPILDALEDELARRSV